MTQNLRTLVESTAFQRLVLATILVGGVVAGVETNPEAVTRYGGWFAAVDRAILVIFGVEAVLKMAVHGSRPWRYFGDPWNVFDFGILVLCFLPAVGPFASVFRLARALRLLRLVSAVPQLQLLVKALLKSLSAMGYVGLLLALLFYVYAVAGVHLLGKADPEHFGSLGVALFTLFRTVTLDNWGDFFHQASERVPAAPVAIYFITFIVLGTMIILNLVIGIVMNSMTEAYREQERDNARANGVGEFGQALTQLAQATEQLAAAQRRLENLRRETTVARGEVGGDAEPRIEPRSTESRVAAHERRGTDAEGPFSPPKTCPSGKGLS